ncbi:hypothetical protein N7922_13875 [Kosakonia sp. ML.JS2a]|uniref:phage tail termination protein n=1 Tax=Kosakonia sp. ML.JS2a TaxID=2980557 RepID=UPI0021DADCFB|nr:hypothetical protein [Kosakonia sp. ML.JS2a]UXY08980.1 hypothetical protein N7922_13875 [Kosakonia sp. ML.JS2a]
MTPSMYERVKNLFVAAGLTDGRIVQSLFFEDTKKASDSFIVFRPNGGTPIRKDLGADHYVLVDVIGPKDKRAVTAQAVQKIIDYVQENPISDTCVGQIENMGGIPPPVLTDEGRIVFRLQFACLYGE